MKKVVIVIEDSGLVSVSFDGEYIRRRELDMAIRTLRKDHKAQLRDYRRQQIIKEYEASKGPQEKKVEAKNDSDRSGESSSGQAGTGQTSNGIKSGDKPDQPSTTKFVTGSAGTKESAGTVKAIKAATG